MKELLSFIIIITILSSCCTDVYFKENERFWFDNYKQGEQLIFESNRGDLDTVHITAVIIKKPTGDCNPMVSNYSHEFVRVDYMISKDTFETLNGWFIQHSAEPGDKKALPVLRFLNMEYNESEGALKEEEIEISNGQNEKVFLFDDSNCGMNYNQKFGLINFKWHKVRGLVSYENADGEVWKLKLWRQG